MYLPDCWKIWLTSVNPFFHKIFSQTDPPSVDLSVGDIRSQIAAEWSHVGFPLTPRSMTLDDLELYKFEFSVNFSGFRRFRAQQQLNE